MQSRPRLAARFPIRARLLLLGALATLPGLAIIFHDSLEAQRAAIEAERAAAAHAVDDLGDVLRLLATDARRLLGTLAQLPEVQRRDAAACDRLFARILSDAPAYASLQADRLDGTVFASGRPFAGPVSAADRRYFRDAVTTGRFAAGEYIVGRVEHEPLLSFALPVRGAGGEVAAVLHAGLAISGWTARLAAIPKPPGAEVVVTDRAGRRVFVEPPAAAAIGAPDDPALLSRMVAERGAFHAGPPEDPRLVVYQRLRLAPGDEPYLTVRLAVPEAPILATGRGVLARGVAMLGLAAALAALAVALVGGTAIAHPVRVLAAAARRIAAGDLGARVGAVHGHGELAELSATFDEMAATLQARDRERERLEAQLRHSQKMEAIGRLAGGVAHDFNNLLTAIRGSAAFLLEDLPQGAPSRADVEEIERAADRATSLTRQLLTFSRRQVVGPAVVDLNDVVRGAARLLSRLIGEDVLLRLELAEPLPPVLADPAQLEQVITNLAVNARDAMPGGGVLTLRTAEIALDAASAPGGGAGRWLRLEVEDTGVGLSPEAREHLFEPFFTTKPAGVGTGLGLATVYGIVKQSGGAVGATSRPGRGTTFAVLLPPAAETAGTTARTAPPTAARGGTERILIVEDEPAVRELARRALARFGYRLTVAATPEEALRLVAEEGLRLDLLLTDVVMPGMGGHELAGRVTALRPGLPVLFMSGYSGPVAPGATPLPALDLVEKPFTVEELARRVRASLDRAGVGAPAAIDADAS